MVRQAHGDAKWKQHAAKLAPDDRSLLEESKTRPYFYEENDRSNMLCFSTSHSYQDRIEMVLFKVLLRAAEAKKHASSTIGMGACDIGWGRILVHERHVENNSSKETIKQVQMLNSTMKDEMPRKIFISRTAFESSPQHMADWIGNITIEVNRWHKPPPVNGYSRMRLQQRSLRFCTSQALTNLGKKHQDLVKALQHGKQQARQALEEYKQKMTVVI